MTALFDPFALVDDPFPAYAAARASGGALLGIAPFPDLGTALYLFRHRQVQDALKHPLLLQAPAGAYQAVRESLVGHRVWAVMTRSMLLADPPRHAPLRRPTAPLMTAGRAASLMKWMRQQADALAENCFARGRFDAVVDYATPLVVAVLARVLGMPLPDTAALKAATGEIARSLDFRLGGLTEESNRACAWMEREIEAALRHGPIAPDGLAAAMLAEEAEGRWERADVVGNLALMLLGGQETTIDAFGNALLLLQRDPAQRGLLERGEIDWTQATEELLRMGPSVHYAGARIAAEDFVLDGVPVAGGSAIVPVLASANRDSEVFASGDSLDLARRPRGLATFGTGLHLCLGQHLARAEIAVLLEAFFAAAPDWRIETEAVRQRGLLLFRGPATLPVTSGAAALPVTQ